MLQKVEEWNKLFSKQYYSFFRSYCFFCIYSVLWIRSTRQARKKLHANTFKFEQIFLNLRIKIYFETKHMHRGINTKEKLLAKFTKKYFLWNLESSFLACFSKQFCYFQVVLFNFVVFLFDFNENCLNSFVYCPIHSGVYDAIRL